jgi:inosine/xanthosine triphosphatase
MKIAVGSTNPVKVAAVRQITTRVWPEAEFTQMAAESGVSSMPMSSAETLLGAENRARNALLRSGADLGIGLEGGVNQETAGLMLMGWVVILDNNGRKGIGGTSRLPLPDSIACRVLAGEELGYVMDDVLNDTNVKQKGGAVGALTKGFVLREDAFAIAVAYALSPYLVPELHDGLIGSTTAGNSSL